MSDVYGGIDYAKIKAKLEEVWQSGGAGREALREELDIHSVFTWEKFLREGLDAHFNARAGPPVQVVKPSSYWISDFTLPTRGKITRPSDFDTLAIYSKRAYNYGILETYILYPELEDGERVWVGFENGAGAGTGIASFMFTKESGVDKLYVVAGGMYGPPTFLDITNLLPDDYKTSPQYYGIHVLGNIIEFFLARVLVAVAINSPHQSSDWSISGPPYGVLPATGVSPSMTTLIELINPAGPLERTLYLGPYYFRVADGMPKAPRVYRLYETGLRIFFAGKTVESGTLTSHAVPVFGYDGKTFYFMADTDSETNGLVIEVMTQSGNWREYDSVTYTANDFWYYPIGGDAVLARLRYTPASYPATVNEGEIVLR